VRNTITHIKPVEMKLRGLCTQGNALYKKGEQESESIHQISQKLKTENTIIFNILPNITEFA
jgi:hypothetical protein